MNSWRHEVAGIVEAWYPGIAGGRAIANLFFGTVNFSGKLPITFAKTEADLPHARVFGMTYARRNGGLPEHWVSEDKNKTFPAELTEGVRFGYKWFDSEGKEPLFPFGYGLSYTSYRYSDLKVDAGSRTATVTIENSGARAGTEIAELYVQLPKSAGEHFRRLAGWQRVPLAPGESKTITLAMEPLALASWDEGGERWTWTPGTYTVSVGSSSRDLPLHADLAVR